MFPSKVKRRNGSEIINKGPWVVKNSETFKEIQLCSRKWKGQCFRFKKSERWPKFRQWEAENDYKITARKFNFVCVVKEKRCGCVHLLPVPLPFFEYIRHILLINLFTYLTLWSRVWAMIRERNAWRRRWTIGEEQEHPVLKGKWNGKLETEWMDERKYWRHKNNIWRNILLIWSGATNHYQKYKWNVCQRGEIKEVENYDVENQCSGETNKLEPT